MTNVSPVNARIKVVDAAGFISREMFRVLDELRQRTGGDDDAIAELQTGEVYEPGVTDGRLKQLRKRIEDLEVDLAMFAQPAALSGLRSLSGVGVTVRTGPGKWMVRDITAPGDGLSITNASGANGNPTVSLANDVAAVEALAGNGIAVRTGTDTWAIRAIQGTTNEIAVSDGSGASADPTISLPSTLDLTPKTLVFATENVKLSDAGSTGATEQDWIKVTVGGVTGYIRVYASK